MIRFATHRSEIGRDADSLDRPRRGQERERLLRQTMVERQLLSQVVTHACCQ